MSSSCTRKLCGDNNKPIWIYAEWARHRKILPFFFLFVLFVLWLVLFIISLRAHEIMKKETNSNNHKQKEIQKATHIYARDAQKRSSYIFTRDSRWGTSFFSRFFSSSSFFRRAQMYVEKKRIYWYSLIIAAKFLCSSQCSSSISQCDWNGVWSEIVIFVEIFTRLRTILQQRRSAFCETWYCAAFLALYRLRGMPRLWFMWILSNQRIFCTLGGMTVWHCQIV